MKISKAGTLLSFLLFFLLPVKLRAQDSLRYFGELQLGLLLGEEPTYEGGDAVTLAPHFTGVAGIAWTNYWQTGLGAGYEGYGRIRLVPLFVQLGGSVPTGKLQPFYALRVGSLLARIQDDLRYQEAKGKWMIEGQLGARLKISPSVGWLLSVGYRRQKITLEGEDTFWGNETYQKRIMQRIPVLTGLRYSF